jgi:hypothetical protein
MSAGELFDVAARGFGYLSILGILAGLSIWALYAAEQRATKRRNAFRDARRRHPAGKALAHTPDHCPPCAEKGVCLCPPCVREAYTGQHHTGDAS